MFAAISLISIYKCAVPYEQEYYAVSMPTPEEYEVYSCTKDPMTFIIEIKIHSQIQVAEAIQSVYNYNSDVKLGIKASSLPYYGKIIDELNEMLLKFKIQIHLNLDAPVTEEFMTDINFDKSCELEDPILERTMSAFGLLKNKYKNSIGLHFFVWQCPRDDPSFVVEQKLDNDKCGRVMGVLWRGTEEERDMVKNEIMYALTGIKGDYTTPAAFNSSIQGELCLYADKCLARNATDIGQKVFGENYIRYTDDFHYE
ncbi:hypothetical protein BDAP_000224 [Binucleata daphniae]